MTEANVNQQHTFRLQVKGNQWEVNETPLEADIVAESGDNFHVLYQEKGYKVSLHKIDRENKEVTLIVNNKKAVVKLTSQTELLLKSLGLSNLNKAKLDVVKAPMPGLIHSILVEVGQSVQKGDPILILEAMKMENVLKAPDAGVVSKIHVNPKASVEKGTVLISF